MPGSRLRPIVALVLLLQFLVLGSGLSCAMAGGAGTGMGVMMARMDMPTPSARLPGTAPAPSRHDAPCGAPSAPGDCHVMAPCAAAALASRELSMPPAPQPRGELVAFVAHEPVSRAFPPELPPPRA